MLCLESTGWNDTIQSRKGGTESCGGMGAARDRIEFADFVHNTWFPICICDSEHKPTTEAYLLIIISIFLSIV